MCRVFAGGEQALGISITVQDKYIKYNYTAHQAEKLKHVSSSIWNALYIKYTYI